jgi:protein-S-isoprenylcysteine O-methyltransferase Ste14
MPDQPHSNEQQPDGITRDASSPFIWPPTIFSIACITAFILFRNANVILYPVGGSTVLRPAGWLLVAVAIVVAVWAEIAFLIAGTATLPISPTSRVVTTGIYARTRNPMYLGMSLFTAGLAFVFNSLWFVIVLPLAVYAVTKLAIEPEEAYLERKFGAEYLDYKSKVRRWL